MTPEDHSEEEFIIPTRYKIKIASYLSWPLGAKEITAFLSGSPQINELDLAFGGHIYPKGKWPKPCEVIEASYSYGRTRYNTPGSNEPHWYLYVYPVPRDLRAQIKGAMLQQGLQSVAAWLIANAKLSGHESYKRFTVNWSSEENELSYISYDNVLPQLSAKKQGNAK